MFSEWESSCSPGRSSAIRSTAAASCRFWLLLACITDDSGNFLGTVHRCHILAGKHRKRGIRLEGAKYDLCFLSMQREIFKTLNCSRGSVTATAKSSWGKAAEREALVCFAGWTSFGSGCSIPLACVTARLCEMREADPSSEILTQL